jgi:hypothetical protein
MQTILMLKQVTCVAATGDSSQKTTLSVGKKGKRPFVGLTALLPCGILYSYPNEFLHSSTEELHTPSGVRDLC